MSGAELHVIVPWTLELRTGGTIYDARLVAGLRRRGWSVTVHALADAGDGGHDRASHDGSRLAETLRVLPDGAPVVIDGLAMAEHPEVVAPHGSRLRMVALVHQVRGDVPSLAAAQRDGLHTLERAALGAMTAVVATSAYSARRLEDLGVDPARIRVVPPGTDPAVPASGPGPGAPPRLLCVASVTPGKGQDVLVGALARLAGTPWTCVLAGDTQASPAFVDHVRALAQEAGLADRVELTGAIDEATLESLYRSSSVVVLASWYEAYGMALAEAMARGLPVVATNAGAIPETVPPGAAILVPPGDDVALAEALRALLVDAPGMPGSAARRRAELGAAGLRHASMLPDQEQSVEAFEAVLAALVEVPAAGRA